MSQTRMLRKFYDAIPADVKEKFMETFMETLGPGEELLMGGQLEHLEIEHGSSACRVENLPEPLREPKSYPRTERRFNQRGQFRGR